MRDELHKAAEKMAEAERERILEWRSEAGRAEEERLELKLISKEDCRRRSETER